MIRYVKIVLGFFVGLFAFDLVRRHGADTLIFWRSLIAAILAVLLLWLLAASNPRRGRP
jgi:multisubunit Na+/H+ antiporter MnhE subunit